MSVNLAKPAAAPAVKKTPKKEQQVRVAPSFTISVEHKSIRFALDVTNPTKKDVELTFPDGQTHDFTVIDSAGRVVYRWAAGRMFTQSVQNKTIDRGETLHIAERVAPSLPQGSYVAVATLRSTNFPVEERFAFELK